MTRSILVLLFPLLWLGCASTTHVVNPYQYSEISELGSERHAVVIVSANGCLEEFDADSVTVEHDSTFWFDSKSAQWRSVSSTAVHRIRFIDHWLGALEGFTYSGGPGYLLLAAAAAASNVSGLEKVVLGAGAILSTAVSLFIAAPVGALIGHKTDYVFPSPLPSHESAEPYRAQGQDAIVHALAHNGALLRRAPREWKDDEKMVAAAVEQNGRALHHASPRIRGDRNTALTAVNQNGMALEYVSEELRNDALCVLVAVQSNGLALQFASAPLRDRRNIVTTAVTRDGRALAFASDTLRNDSVIVMHAVRSNGMALEFASETLRGHRNIVLAAIAQNPCARNVSVIR